MDKDWYDVTLEDIKHPDDLQAALDNAFNAGIETGEEEGYNEGIYSSVVEDRVEEAKKEGYVKGVEREQNRIHEVIKMHMRWAEEQNKGKDYMFWKNVKEILTPFNFEPWSEEEWQEELAKDGF